MVGSAWVGAGILRRRPAVSKVHPELRSPLLYAPLSLRDHRSLQLGRGLLAGRTTPIAEGVDVDERSVEDDDGSTRVLVYEPQGRTRPSPALIWLHGGGFVMGQPEQAHEFASRVAKELGALVVNIAYRLAPEHPFPAGLEAGRAPASCVPASVHLGHDECIALSGVVEAHE